jgi:GntR family transcriptional regulator
MNPQELATLSSAPQDVDQLRSTGVAMYAKIASTLRRRIASGEWKLGDQLPTVEALAADLGVSRITVRQAYGLLVAEGLLDSRRGRGTHVSGLPPSRDDGIRSAINSEMVDAAELQIHVLEIRRDQLLPAAFQDPATRKSSFVQLKKLHVHRGTPFCFGEMFVRQSVFDRFPKNAENNSKINRLIRDILGDRVDTLRQRITVEPSSDQVARLLRISPAATVAVVRRTLKSTSGAILSAGDFYYRSDQFVLESEVPASLTEVYPSLSHPEKKS